MNPSADAENARFWLKADMSPLSKSSQLVSNLGAVGQREVATLFRRIAFVIGLALLAACAGGPEITVAEAERKYLDYLKVGQTTREEVISRLGAPAAVFENERILTYWLRLTAERGFVVDNSGAAYGLTLVFDRSDRLEKHKLLKQ